MKENQKVFWEDNKVLKRRTPDHPVIKAFALPKVDLILETIKPSRPGPKEYHY